MPPRWRCCVRDICGDRWEPFTQSPRASATTARIVYDKFHVLQHPNAVVEETRRGSSFRKDGRLRGNRWLRLTRWHYLEPEERQPLTALLAVTRWLAKAYQPRRQREQLWSYTYEGEARRFLKIWIRALRGQRLPAFQQFASLPHRHLDGILAPCHVKVPFGVGEAVDGNIGAVIHLGRGYRDHEYLLLKVQRRTAEGRRLGAA